VGAGYADAAKVDIGYANADGSIGVVMEFADDDFEAYAMPDLAFVGVFKTKAQAAQALGTHTRASPNIKVRCLFDPRRHEPRTVVNPQAARRRRRGLRGEKGLNESGREETLTRQHVGAISSPPESNQSGRASPSPFDC
jgi:hypothetical protein